MEPAKIMQVGSGGSKLCSGITTAGEWQYYNYGIPHDGTTALYCGASIEVDISSCNFENPPIITSSIDGSNSHWKTVGGSSIYSRTATGFRIYVRKTYGVAPGNCDAADLPNLMHNLRGWKIMWQATGN